MNQTFLDEIKQRLDAERDADDSVTPEQAAALRTRYPMDTPEAFRHIKPEEFFDGAL